jgi:PBP1b-binding outer membrane lipoprotein LpoB
MKKFVLLILITCFVLPGCVSQSGKTNYQAKNIRNFNKQKWRKKRDRNVYLIKEKYKE